MSEDRDFDFEPLPGLPEPLPSDERMLWRGSPAAWPLAVRSFRLPIVGAYFVALAGWQLAGAVHAGTPAMEIVRSLSWTAALCAMTIAILAGLGWVIAHNTVYTVTSRRIILRHGVAMPMAINLPFSRIDAAGYRGWGDGTGDIAFKLRAGERVSHLLLWPHARPLTYFPSQPMLRAVPDGQRVSELIATALAASAEQPAPVAATQPHAATVERPARPVRAAARDTQTMPIGQVAAS